MTYEQWVVQAGCAGVDPELFIEKSSWREAKRICRTCQVQQECLDYALERPRHQSIMGVWGGTTPDERNTLREGRRTAWTGT